MEGEAERRKRKPLPGAQVCPRCVHFYLGLACEHTSLKAGRRSHAERRAREKRPSERLMMDVALCAWEKGSYRCDAEREAEREEEVLTAEEEGEEEGEGRDSGGGERSGGGRRRGGNGPRGQGKDRSPDPPLPVRKRPLPSSFVRGATLKKAKLPPVPYPSDKPPPLRLYFRKLFRGGRPEIHVFDCHNDLDKLSSDLVQQCYFVSHAPDHLLREQHTLGSAARYMDAAVEGTGLKEGRNYKELFCVDAEGKTTLKRWFKSGKTARDLVG